MIGIVTPAVSVFPALVKASPMELNVFCASLIDDEKDFSNCPAILIAIL